MSKKFLHVEIPVIFWVDVTEEEIEEYGLKDGYEGLTDLNKETCEFIRKKIKEQDRKPIVIEEREILMAMTRDNW